jgi:hypothetical protein
VKKQPDHAFASKDGTSAIIITLFFSTPRDSIGKFVRKSGQSCQKQVLSLLSSP